MSRSFEVPSFYKGEFLTQIKSQRHAADPKRRDTQPSLIDCGPVRFLVARHFGFCFGVENAIDIAYRAVRENPGKRIFLLSEIIHNQEVNSDLLSHGIRFLMDTSGRELVPLKDLTSNDIVIVPAFGTTLEIQAEIRARGIDVYAFDSTCPFVKKVWKRAAELGRAGYTVIVHGKREHEETRATFSHSKEQAPTLVLLNLEEAKQVIAFLKGEMSRDEFERRFSIGMSAGFEPDRDLKRIGVVNQTTMLASETLEISSMFRQAMLDLYGEEDLAAHFADTKDTLCYATYENQGATRALVETGADLALVIGGYNSSNTSHLVELAEQHMPTYYVKNVDEILDRSTVRHLDTHAGKVIETAGWLPEKTPLTIAVTAGASCPDRSVEQVMKKVASFYGAEVPTVSSELEAP